MAALEPTDLVKEARKRWERAAEAENAQRKQILEAKQFRAGDQWPASIKVERQGGPAVQGQAPTPPRPCLTIDRLSQPVRQISNQIKSANFAIEVLPNGNGSDTETAEIFKGILRRIQNQARGESPIEWAADGAIEGGIGWFRLRTEYVYQHAEIDGPELFDQEVRIERILNNLSVYCDPAAVKPTRSDARFMFVTEDLPRDEYRRRYPKRKDGEPSALASLDFMAPGDTDTWITEDMVRVAEYWRIEDETETVHALPDGTIQRGGTAPEGAKTRTILTPKVKCSIINGVEELEAYEWPGSHIPLIPILGEELNVDGRSVLRGVIDEGKDAQRMVNYMYSAAIETVALAPKSPLIIAEGQLEGYQALWQNANRLNYAYLPYKPTSLNGTPVPPPQRDQAEPAIQAMVLMLAKSEEAIKATTGIHDPSLGKDTAQEKSGRAIQALQAQGELGSSNYPDNVRRALIYAGEQIVEVLPKITRPGQVMTILGMDEEPQQVIIGQPYEEKDGRAIPRPDIDPEQAKLQKGLAKFYDLKAGTYSVTVAVGKAFATRREEGRMALGDLIPHLPPPMAAAVTPEFIETLDMPDAHKIAETARRALPPELRPPDDKNQPDPAQLQQQLQQMGQMLQALTQELNAKNQIIETDQVKLQAELQKAQLQEQAETERAQIEAQTRILLEQRKLEVQLEIEMAKLGSAQSMARAEIEQEQLHAHGEMVMRQQEQQAAAAQADLDRQAERDEAEQGRAFEADQAERGRQAEAERAMLGNEGGA